MKYLAIIFAFLLTSNIANANEVTPNVPVYAFESEHPIARVICLHDVCGSGSQLGRFAEKLKKRQNLSVYTIDQCGYNRSNEGRIDIKKTEASLADLLEKLNKKNGPLPVYILGEGSGAAVALDFCTKMTGTNAAGTILVNPTCPESLEIKKEHSAYLVFPMGYSSESRTQLSEDPQAKLLFSSGELALLKQLLLAQEKNATACQLPVLMIAGDQIESRDRELSRRLFERISSFSKRFLIEPGHRNLIDYNASNDGVIDRVGDWLKVNAGKSQ